MRGADAEGITEMGYRDCCAIRNSPVALARALLLDVLGVGVDVATLGEVAREMLFGAGGAIGEADVITSIGFV